MANRKLNIDLSKPRSWETQMQLLAFANKNRKATSSAIGKWLAEKKAVCNGNEEHEMWYEQDALDMKRVLLAQFSFEAEDRYMNLDTLVRDWLMEIAESVYLAKGGAKA